MDKCAIGFLADVLYIKGVICFEEFEDMQNVVHPSDLQDIVEKMLRSEYNGYRRGEGYVLTVDGE
jgi:hypothetical protein